MGGGRGWGVGVGGSRPSTPSRSAQVLIHFFSIFGYLPELQSFVH